MSTLHAEFYVILRKKGKQRPLDNIFSDDY